jgi:nucleoid-associated protein YgaU
MGKEAKIGLAIVGSLLIILGGVVAWRMRTSSTAATAQAAEEQKEKPHHPGESNAGKAEAGSNEFKPKHQRDARDMPKIVSPAAGTGHPPKTGEGENNPWGVPADYRHQKDSSNEAIAIAPPPRSMMPEPPMADNVDPKDRNGSKRRAGENPYRQKERPAEAVASADPKQHKNPFDALIDEQNQAPGSASAEGYASPDLVQATPSPDASDVETQDNSPSPYGQYEPVSTGGHRYGKDSVSDRSPSNYQNNQQAGYEASYENKKPHHGIYGKSNESGYNKTAGLRSDGTYDVQPNDSFWTISEKKYKTGAYYKALEELNRGKVLDGRLKVGQNLLLPEASVLEKKYPNLCPKANHRDVLVQNKYKGNIKETSGKNFGNTRSYTVAEGDTLFDIARYELGKASRWAEIYELNQDVLGKDFDYLVPGTQLALPEDAPSHPNPIARRPEKENRRY